MIGNSTSNDCNQVIGRKLVSNNHTTNQDMNNMVKEKYDLQQLVLANSNLIEFQHEEQLKEKQHLQALAKDYEEQKTLIEKLKAKLAACQCSNNNSFNSTNNIIINQDQQNIQNQQSYQQYIQNQQSYQQPIQQLILHPNVQQIQQQTPVPQYFNQQAQGGNSENGIYEQQTTNFFQHVFVEDATLQLQDYNNFDFPDDLLNDAGCQV